MAMIWTFALTNAVLAASSVVDSQDTNVKPNIKEVYNPNEPIVIHPPFKGLDDFLPEELPDFLKRWERLPPNTPPHQLFYQEEEVMRWAVNYYSPKYMIITNEAINFEVKVPQRGATFKIVANEYQWRDGKIYYLHNGVKTEITIQEFEKRKYFWAQRICESAEYLSNLTSAMPNLIMKIHEERLKKYGVLKEKESLADRLAQASVPPGVKPEELMFILTKLSFADFIPNTAIITPLRVEGGFILGATFPDTGVVYFHPLSFILDYLKHGDTTPHELWHRNSSLQGLLVNALFDPEIWASYIERNDWGLEYFHPYQRSAREAGEVIAGFNAQRAIEEMFQFNYLGSLKINPKKFDQHCEGARKIHNAFREVLLKDFLAEFYGNLLFWGCVNDYLLDKNGALQTYLYSRFAPSLLGGVEATVKWLETNREVLREAYERAKRKVEESRKSPQGGQIIQINRQQVVETMKLYARLLNISYNDERELTKKMLRLYQLGVFALPQVKFINPRWNWEVQNALR
ncbi:hypothetical protein D6821_02580 [Candidatus Parcubacteria bacterium]|nr:MAG: hypothetical protein D6821_02580 [Candidatus Parcubacteria bacterium]